MMNCDYYGIKSYSGHEDMITTDKPKLTITFKGWNYLKAFEDWMRSEFGE